MAAVDSTIEEILAECKRFRIVCVGGSGTGKSSLIKDVFQVEDANLKVSDDTPGEVDIYSEFISPTNEHFILHDSKGFEPADTTTFDIVRKFLVEKSSVELKLSQRLHAVWLCIQTPTDGARVLESGDEEFLELAHERQIPVVIVFTQYDRLVRKYMMDNSMSLEQARIKAREQLEGFVRSLEEATERLQISTPHYINVSVREGYNDQLLSLVQRTREVVEERLPGDAWIIWATAQKKSIDLKIEACIRKGMGYYGRILLQGIPGVGKDLLLRNSIVQVHRDIITCWNFRDGEIVLDRDDFKHLMLSIVQEMQHEDSTKPERLSIEKINQFVALCTVASASIAPPVAVLGLTFVFVNWLSTAVLENTADAQRVLIAYVADFILVLEELFKISLRHSASGRISWDELREVFTEYLRSTSSKVHAGVRDIVKQHGPLGLELIRLCERVEALIRQHRSFM